ncbi:MAG TPA: DUF938 domain-containing protein [Burkholderiaceae bacterium]|nr:DUF938 domain-containing protein [Burkholderiaceae bacterium]
MSIDLRPQLSPAAERNKQPILDVLQNVLPQAAPQGGTALEIASGTGQHVVHFAAAFPDWTWQPSDVKEDALASIAMWTAQARLQNVRPPLWLDVTAPVWPGVGTVDAIFCANMIHIAPWAACAGLMRGAARVLAPHGVLVVYGPFFVEGEAAVPSNVAFDADLRARNRAWGVRRLQAVVDEAARVGLALQERFAMPANNLIVVFRRREAR